MIIRVIHCEIAKNNQATFQLQNRKISKINVTVYSEGFDVAVFTVDSVLMNVNDLFTLTHFHLFQNMFIFPLTLCTIHEYKTGNDVSEFTHSNCITLSYKS